MATKAKILIVDDEPLNIDYLEQELEDLEYETVSAANGQEALQRLAETQPDMVLLDIMMPVMDGFEMLGRMKSTEEWRDVPVVIITALTDMDSVVRGIQLGADDYLTKPFNPVLLAARLNAGLARKRVRDLEKAHLANLERDLEIGHQIQNGFLPASLPKIPGWDIAAYFQAAREVAGDFYDVFCLTDNHLGFFLGDVTDKGVGSALYMALYRSLLRAFINDGTSPIPHGPAEVCDDLLQHAVTRANQYVCQTHERPLFATLFIGILEPLTGQLNYVNAGHNPPQIFSLGEKPRELIPTGPSIGLSADTEFAVAAIQLAPEECLLVYSDGAEDTKNPEGEFFGKERLLESLAQPALSAQQSVDHLASRLAEFMGEAPRFDDVTLLAITRH